MTSASLFPPVFPTASAISANVVKIHCLPILPQATSLSYTLPARGHGDVALQNLGLKQMTVYGFGGGGQLFVCFKQTGAGEVAQQWRT